jgi:tight adherence protein B
MKKKGKKKNKYIPKVGCMGNAEDYQIYTMNREERWKGFLIGFGVAVVVMLIFFRSLLVALPVGLLAGWKGVSVYRKWLQRRRKENLLLQFKDFMEALSTAYSAGHNTREAFADSAGDLMNTYGEEADIVKEVQIIQTGLENGYTIEVLLQDFADRSGLEDIRNFADVFTNCHRRGVDVRKVVNDTRMIISEKMEIEQEIKSLLNGGKNELNIMIVMPLIIVLMLGNDSAMSVAGNTHTNIIVKIIALTIFLLAYIWGKKITDIKM